MRKIAILVMFLALGQISHHLSLASSPPIIWLYEISATTVALGEMVSISWIVIAADKVTIDNGVGEVGLAGTKKITPDTPGMATFTLTAKNAAGTSAAQLSCEVLEFEKFFGGGWDDEGNCVQATFDGGYIVTGVFRTKSSGGEDIVLLKTDVNGEKLWEKTFGGSGTDKGLYVLQTSDGGYVIGCQSFVHNLIKTDASGNTVWEKQYAWPYCVKQTSDGGFILAAGKNRLIKTDALGNLLWYKEYSGTDTLYSVCLASDGGFILTGVDWQNNSVVDEIFLIKTDALGNQIWRRQFGGTTWDRGYSVVEASDGGYIVAGTTQQGYGNDVFWLIKTDASGNTVWDKKFPNSQSECSTGAYAVIPTPDGGAIAAGSYEIWGPEEQDVYIVKVDGSGNVVWSKIIGGDGYEAARFIAHTQDGGLIVTGIADTEMTAGDDILLMKIK